jgi:hypothetical protein
MSPFLNPAFSAGLSCSTDSMRTPAVAFPSLASSSATDTPMRPPLPLNTSTEPRGTTTRASCPCTGAIAAPTPAAPSRAAETAAVFQSFIGKPSRNVLVSNAY